MTTRRADLLLVTTSSPRHVLGLLVHGARKMHCDVSFLHLQLVDECGNPLDLNLVMSFRHEPREVCPPTVKLFLM